jgi:hypothetical protein
MGSVEGRVEWNEVEAAQVIVRAVIWSKKMVATEKK